MIRTEEQHTAATKHAAWNPILAEIEARYAGLDTVQQWCVRAVGASLMGAHDHAKEVFTLLGGLIAKAVVDICKRHGVDLSADAAHVKS